LRQLIKSVGSFCHALQFSHGEALSLRCSVLDNSKQGGQYSSPRGGQVYKLHGVGSSRVKRRAGGLCGGVALIEQAAGFGAAFWLLKGKREAQPLAVELCAGFVMLSAGFCCHASGFAVGLGAV
jgi:hypothetical protein